MEQKEQINLTIAQAIRERSQAGRLIQLEEIWAELSEQGFLKSETADDSSGLEPILTQVLASNDDIREIQAANGMPYYYSVRSLSGAYAGILARKEQDPLPLVAHTVRENSKIYPRPVPLDIFSESPFDLTREEILDCLKKMGEQEDYQDITRTTTSIGTVFLYSTEHLNPDYASMLAEWADVGQASNP
jgi:hypothetical protein